MLRTTLSSFLAAAPLVALACTAGSGEAVMPEVREAGALEPSPRKLTPGQGEDSGAAPVEQDAGGEDAPADAGPEEPPPILINEIYVDIDTLGDGAEFV